MRFTLEAYGQKTIVEFENDDVALPELLHAICNAIVTSGYSRHSVIELFNDDDTVHNNPFEWDLS